MRTSLLARVVRAVVVAAIVAWSLGPILIGLVTSLSTLPDVNAVPARWVPSRLTTDAYQSLIGGTATRHAGGTVAEAGAFQQALGNSTIVAVAVTVTVLVLATMAAYAFARLRFGIGRVLLTALVATLLVPSFVFVVALFQLLADHGLIDTRRGLWLVLTATTTPLATWLMYNQVRDLPRESEEAALIDGCHRFQAFRLVVVPQLRSGLAAVAAIVFLSVWGEFLIPLVLTSTETAKPVTVLITEYVGKYTTNYPVVAAAGMLVLLPPALLVLALNRRITGMLGGSS